MAFVRMVLPAWFAGLYAALLLVLLVLFLNLDLPAGLPVLAGLLPWALVLSIPPALAWPLAYRFLRLFARRPVRARGVPFKYLYGFACADLFLVSWLFEHNAGLAQVMVPPAAVFRLHLAAALIAAAALLFLAVAVFRPLRRRAGARACCHLAALLLPVVLILARPGDPAPPAPSFPAEPVRPSPAAPRTLVLGIEGATLDQILPLSAQGKLPWFSRLLQRGAHGRLSPFRPCVPPVVWESLWTGKLPYKHGVLGFDRYRLPWGGGEIRRVPRGLAFRRLAAAAGMSRRRQGGGESSALTFSDIATRLGSSVRMIDGGASAPLPPPQSGGPDIRLERFLDPEVPEPPGTAALSVFLRRSLRRDQAAAAAGLAAWREGREKTVIVVLPGLDRISHLFLRFGMPSGFGDVPPEEIEKYGSVLERYYRFLDEWLGRFLEEEEFAGEGGPPAGKAVCLVVSPHGIEPMPLGRRMAAWLAGNPLESGFHDRGPDGVILVSGPGIRHGAPLGKASVMDVAPTLLYMNGLPVGMDMDGHALTRLFDAEFRSENPILLVPTYEAGRAPTSPGT